MTKHEGNPLKFDTNIFGFDPSPQDGLFSHSATSDELLRTGMAKTDFPTPMTTNEVSSKKLVNLDEGTFRNDHTTLSMPECQGDDDCFHFGFDPMQSVSNDILEPKNLIFQQIGSTSPQACKKGRQLHVGLGLSSTAILKPCEIRKEEICGEKQEFTMPSSEANQKFPTLLGNWTENTSSIQYPFFAQSVLGEPSWMCSAETDASSLIQLPIPIDEDPLEDVGELGDISEFF